MARFLKKGVSDRGLPPGTLVFVGTRKMEHTRLRLIDYDAQNLVEKDLADITECGEFLAKKSVSWVNVDGIHNAADIEKIGVQFSLESLLLEDIMDSSQRPKIAEFETCLFIVLKMLRLDESKLHIVSEQFSLAISGKFLLTFQEQVGDVFDPVRERLRKGRKRIRGSGPDYLAYALLDTIIENYIRITETLGEQVEAIEDLILDNPGKDIVVRINDLKQEFNYLRKCIRPAIEVVQRVPRLENDFVKKSSLPYWNDLRDMVVQAAEVVDAYRDMLTDHLNIYHTTVSSRMNDIMKVLTIFAAIFIPLTFIAGIYGTNFDVLPELHLRYGYFAMLGVMAVVAGGMLLWFRRNKWL